MKILFVINPISGRTTNEKALLRIHELAVEQGFDFKFHYTTGEQDELALEKQIKKYKPDKVIAGGGDGTVQLVARTLMYTNMPMGILPLGSANGLATALNIPQRQGPAVDAVINYNTITSMDLLRINDEHICVHLGDIGINALVVKRYSETPERGMIAYAKHTLKAIKESPLLNYIIKTPLGAYEKEGYMLAFANANQYGTGIQISEGNISDGKFEICNIPKIAWNEFIKAGLTKFNVYIDENMFAEVLSVESAEIFINQKIHLQIDGEYMGETDHIKIEIIPAAIKLLTADVL